MDDERALPMLHHHHQKLISLSLSSLPSANSTISTVNKIGIHSTFIYTMHVCHIICETLQGWAWLWQCVMIMMMKSLRVNQARLFASCVSFSTHHICKFVAPTQTTLIHTHIIRPTAQTQLTRHNQWTLRVWILIHIHTYSSCYVRVRTKQGCIIYVHMQMYMYKNAYSISFGVSEATHHTTTTHTSFYWLLVVERRPEGKSIALCGLWNAKRTLEVVEGIVRGARFVRGSRWSLFVFYHFTN